MAPLSALPAEKIAPGDPVVFAVDRGWHTDIGLAVSDLSEVGPLASFPQAFPGANHLVFGFGERAFYQDAAPDVLDMLRALFPNPAAVLVTGLRRPPAEAFGSDAVVPLRVSRAGFARLEEFLGAAVERDAAGVPRRLAPGPYPGSLFFEGTGTYSAAYTCNTWTAEGLARAGLPISPAGVVFSDQVMKRARAAAMAQRHRTAAADAA